MFMYEPNRGTIFRFAPRNQHKQRAATHTCLPCIRNPRNPDITARSGARGPTRTEGESGSSEESYIVAGG